MTYSFNEAALREIAAEALEEVSKQSSGWRMREGRSDVPMFGIEGMFFVSLSKIGAAEPQLWLENDSEVWVRFVVPVSGHEVDEIWSTRRKPALPRVLAGLALSSYDLMAEGVLLRVEESRVLLRTTAT